MLDRADRHGAVALHPGVRLERHSRVGENTHADAQLTRNTAPPEHDIACERLHEAGRPGTPARDGGDRAVNALDGPRQDALRSRSRVPIDQPPQAGEPDDAKTGPGKRHHARRLNHEMAIRFLQRSVTAQQRDHASSSSGAGARKRREARGIVLRESHLVTSARARDRRPDCSSIRTCAALRDRSRRPTAPAMSGIVGIVNLDGRPVDARLLDRLTRSMANRGPDDRRIWSDGAAGLGHALLRTGGAEPDAQPASLDGRVWITADARVDGREALVADLEGRGRTGVRTATDAQLILHAYHTWAEDCVDHLLGDFAFAIWDGRTRHLFCARDHFGIKPFYYARIPGGIVFSNALGCVRLHPGVGDALNELAVCDFLLFGHNQEPATTTFADVSRLPAAHRLTGREGALRVERYWTLPTEGRIRYRRSHDYVHHFLEVMRAAVSDRIAPGGTAVRMSGGLDSTSIAALARHCMGERGSPSTALRAHTVVFDTLIPDEERKYARAAADALGIPIEFLALDDCAPFDGWNHPSFRTPEPLAEPFFGVCTDQLTRIASRARVVLSGDGGDEILRSSYLVDLLGRMPAWDLAADVARSLARHRRRPGLGLRAWLRRRRPSLPQHPPFPVWMNCALSDRLDLRDRWARWHAGAPAGNQSPRAEAHLRLTTAPWPWYFESLDPGVTGVGVEVRYPFLDLRVIVYLLAIPPIPWCIDKEILRLAMRGALPDSIRLRRKSPLGGDPLRARLNLTGAKSLDRFDAAPGLEHYVDRAAIPPLAGGGDDIDPELHVRPLCLNYWFTHVRQEMPLEEIST